ncbi:MAG: winged helix DNA-binding protein [Candidatus Dormibacteraeota bacterium]|nr:winged helix DNA-binding protein [Candidatus Dormibacteraeota bacterium]
MDEIGAEMGAKQVVSDVVAESALAAEERRAALAGELVAVFGALARRFRTAIPDALEAELGTVTPHQLEALHVLLQTSEGGTAGLTMNELARLQGCALSSASALVDRLLREGLVERVSDAADRRVVRVVPTAKGDAFCRQFAQAKRSVALQIVCQLTGEEMETLIALMRKATSGATRPGSEVVHG